MSTLRNISRLVFALAISLSAVTPAWTQQQPRPASPAAAPGSIRGTVADAETKQPLASATVEVWSAADTSLVAGAIAGADGSFRIEGLVPGGYRLRVTMLGYATQNTQTLMVTAAAPVAAGTISLAPAAIAVDGVSAVAERQIIIAPDRNSYSAKQIAPAATTASEVLENVPSVQVDADGKLSLRGNENVVVQVNGRPTPIRGAQLAGYLKQLPANTIERVEVIPNPSAKHDPEGMAGIINIVMKQGVDLGTSGGFVLTASTANRYSAGANFGHQRGALALSGSYGFFADSRNVLGINDRTRLAPSGSPLSYTEQDIDGEMENQGHNLSLNVDYTLNPRDVLSATLQGNRRSTADGALTAYHLLDGARVQTDEYDRFRDFDTKNWLGDASLSFRRTLTPQKHELSAEVRGNRVDDVEFTEMWRIGAQPDRIDIERQDVDALTSQLTGQADYTRTLGQALKLETGYKGNGRWFERDFERLEDVGGTGDWQRSNLSNALAFDETVNAVYGVLSRAGKKFDAQGGLRLEHASRTVTLRDSQESFPHSYSSLYPSGLLTWKADDKTQVKISYSRRVRRPSRDELNPFPQFFDLQNVLIGNPRLDPEYTDAMELGYQRSMPLGSLQIAPFFRRTSGVISVDFNTADTISGREVSSVRFKNLDHNTSWGADVNTQLNFGPKASGLVAFNVAKIVTDGGSESALSSNAVAWSMRFNATYNVREKTALIASYFYRGPVVFGRGRMNALGMANLSIRQRLYDDKVSLVARLSDPFRQQKFSARAEDENIIQLTDRTFSSRAVHISLQFNTGQAPRLRQRRQDEPVQSSNPFGQ